MNVIDRFYVFWSYTLARSPCPSSLFSVVVVVLKNATHFLLFFEVPMMNPMKY